MTKAGRLRLIPCDKIATRKVILMITYCPHCKQGVENRADLANLSVSCPKCHREFTMPPFTEPTSFAAPRREPMNHKRGNDTQTMLLGGILLCGVLVVGMMAAWEIRYQYVWLKLDGLKERIEQRSP